MLMDVGGRSIFFWEERERGKDAKKKKKVVGSQVVGSMTWIVGHVPILTPSKPYVQGYIEAKIGGGKSPSSLGE